MIVKRQPHLLAHDRRTVPSGDGGRQFPDGRSSVPTAGLRGAVCAVLAVMIVTAGLWWLPGRKGIAPRIEPDYCHQLIAVERAVSGAGFTSLQPVAPGQPWTWSYDFGFLTQWPAGYPLLVWAVRALRGISTLEACRWVSVLSFAAALVGWFVWLYCCCRTCYRVEPEAQVHDGPSKHRRRAWSFELPLRVALAGAGACVAVSVGFLIHPSTDAILVAGVPVTLWLVHQALLADQNRSAAPREAPSGTTWYAFAGLTAGLLVWIRYASIFLPIGIGAYLLLERKLRGRPKKNGLVVYLVAASAPIIFLLAMNRAMGHGAAWPAQVNLGHRMVFDPSATDAVRAWWRFTDLGYYDHYWWAHMIFALFPLAFAGTISLSKPLRRTVGRHMLQPSSLLSLTVVAAFLSMLIAVTTFFRDKYDFVELDRYYLPVRPLYFSLFVAPLLALRSRLVQAFLCAGLVLAGSWSVRQEWRRDFQRERNRTTEVTPFGQRATCFSPGASELYIWVKIELGGDVILVSNFREYIALETGRAPLPIPPDRETLEHWISRVSAHRGIESPRVLFVLDPDHRWRGSWLPPLDWIVKEFNLKPYPSSPAGHVWQVLDYTAARPRRRHVAVNEFVP